MLFEKRVKSLTDFLDDGVADILLFDNCAIGTDFIKNGSGLRLSTIFATANNVNVHKLRESLRSAKASLKVIQEYEQTGIVPIIFLELEKKQEFLRNYLRAYNPSRDKSRTSFPGKEYRESKRSRKKMTHHQKIEKRILERICSTQEEILQTLRGRIYTEDERKVAPFEELVTAAYRDIGHSVDTKNNHDEMLIAAAIYLATQQGKYVGVVTHDTRLRSIMVKTQIALSGDKERGKEIKEQLALGKVMIIKEFSPNRGFEIGYCSCDFINDNREIPESLLEKVEACYS